VGPGTTGDRALTLLAVAVIFGLVNAIVRPIVRLISIPLFILTLGLFTFVVNALMLLLTAWIGDQFDLAFKVDGFWSALLGALVISVVTFILNVLLPDEYEGR
jgi:putative membrane protein